jgi:hypothetical protein
MPGNTMLVILNGFLLLLVFELVLIILISLTRKRLDKAQNERLKLYEERLARLEKRDAR